MPFLIWSVIGSVAAYAGYKTIESDSAHEGGLCYPVTTPKEPSATSNLVTISQYALAGLAIYIVAKKMKAI